MMLISGEITLTVIVASVALREAYTPSKYSTLLIVPYWFIEALWNIYKLQWRYILEEI